MFQRLWKRWKVLAHRMGMVQSRMMLNLFYFFILPPFALVVRLSSDPLSLIRRPRSSWFRKEQRAPNHSEHAGRQF